MTTKPGTSIIEIVIATALISTAIIAALSLANRTQKQNTYARNLVEATKYGSEALDWVRTQRNELGWATLSAKVQTDGSGQVTYCLNAIPGSGVGDFLDLAPGSCAPSDYISDTRFTRELKIDTSQVASEVLTVGAEITWAEQTPRHSYVETELTPWR